MSYLWYWPSGGWDYDAWKARDSWQPPRYEEAQRPAFPLVKRGATLEDWLARRGTLMQITRELLGELTDLPPGRMRHDVLEERAKPGYDMRRLRYTLTDDESGFGWLLLPHDRTGPSPCVIALHQTVPQGKDEPVGIVGDPGLAYGAELAARGFVVFAPDAIGFGERRMGCSGARYHSADQFFAAHPAGSVMAKMAYDVSRAIDLLAILPEIDAERVGCIGHSHGGYGTLFAMLLDERIRAGVISCGMTRLRDDPTPERWWRNTALIPRLGYYEGRMHAAPFDFDTWLALLAPRPALICVALEDSIFPNSRCLFRAIDRGRAVYRTYGCGRNLNRFVYDGGHRFPPEARTKAYEILEKALTR